MSGRSAILTSTTAFPRSARSKLQKERLAPERFALRRMAYLKLINLRSSLDKFAPVKFIPWREKKNNF